jgi:Cft2 family RNA processing exonuclease
VLTGDCDLSQNALKGAGKLQKLLAQEKEHLESFIEAREKEKVFVNPGSFSQEIITINLQIDIEIFYSQAHLNHLTQVLMLTKPKYFTAL